MYENVLMFGMVSTTDRKLLQNCRKSFLLGPLDNCLLYIWIIYKIVWTYCISKMPAKNSVEKKAFIEIGKSQCYYRCCQKGYMWYLTHIYYIGSKWWFWIFNSWVSFVVTPRDEIRFIAHRNRNWLLLKRKTPEMYWYITEKLRYASAVECIIQKVVEIGGRGGTGVQNVAPKLNKISLLGRWFCSIHETKPWIHVYQRSL